MRRFLKYASYSAAVLLLLAILVLQVSPIFNPPKWDEYIVLYDSQRILLGQTPYSDYFNIIPPGSFLFFAACFEVAGESNLTVGRYSILPVVLLTVLLGLLALKRRGWSSAAAFGWAAVYPLCVFPYWGVPSHHWLALACGAGLLLVLASGEAGKLRKWGMAGVLVGLGGLFLQEAGIILGVVSLIFLLLREKPGGRRFAAWGAGLGAVWIPVLVWLYARGALYPFFKDVLVWPVRNYSRAGNENAAFPLLDVWWRLVAIRTHFLAHGGGHDLLIALGGFLLYGMLLCAFAAFVAMACCFLARFVRSKTLGGPWKAAAVAVTFLQLGLILKGSANWLHWLFATPFLLLLWTAALGGWQKWSLPRRRLGEAALLLLLAGGLIYNTRGLWVHRPRAWELTDADRPVRESPLNRFLHQPGNLLPGRSIAAFPEGGEVYMYGVKPAVGYTYFTPLSENYSTIKDHSVVARQIEENRPQWIVMPLGMEKEYLASPSPVATIIKENYFRYGVVGTAVLYRERVVPAVGR